MCFFPPNAIYFTVKQCWQRLSLTVFSVPGTARNNLQILVHFILTTTLLVLPFPFYVGGKQSPEEVSNIPEIEEGGSIETRKGTQIRLRFQPEFSPCLLHP